MVGCVYLLFGLYCSILTPGDHMKIVGEKVFVNDQSVLYPNVIEITCLACFIFVYFISQIVILFQEYVFLMLPYFSNSLTSVCQKKEDILGQFYFYYGYFTLKVIICKCKKV